MKIKDGDWIRIREVGLVEVYAVAKDVESDSYWIIASIDGHLRAFIDSQIVELRADKRSVKR